MGDGLWSRALQFTQGSRLSNYHWALLDGYAKVLHEILVKAEGAPAASGTPRPGALEGFPTPPDAGWEDVRIRFIDGHTVSIKVKAASETHNYTSMGMANRKNANPTVQWVLLRGFAEGHGVFDWKSPGADRKNQKRREQLGKNLRAFFGIEGDPFLLTEDRRGWRTRFQILPEAE